MSAPVANRENEVICCCCRRRAKGPSQEIQEVAARSPKNSASAAKVPFSGDLPKDLCPGKAICVSGVVLPKCSRFALNLTCGRGPYADVAFHLNPRLLQRYVVRNSFLNGHWGQEEKTSTVAFPFSRNHSQFQLTVLVADNEFLVAVDGVHFCTFKFRVPWEKVTGIDIQELYKTFNLKGMVDVLGVEYKVLSKYPESSEATPRIAQGRKENIEAGLKTGMETPVTFLLPEGFRRNWQLEIYGRVKILPHSFYVNLQQGAHRWPHPNIPLHLNLRFGIGSGESIFVRNAWIDNGWGQEERTPGFQFEPGSPFTMAIRRADDHFSVWIDGKLAGEFKFRADVENIDVVHIEGDVLLYHLLLDKESNNLTTING